MDLLSRYTSSSSEDEEETTGQPDVKRARCAGDEDGIQPGASAGAVSGAHSLPAGDVSKPVRVFPHVVGNWASHVYVDLAVSEALEEMVEAMFKNMVETVKDKALWLKQEREFHVSLSKTVTLQMHHIDTFVERLKKALRIHRSFVLEFPELHIFANDNFTRGFLALRCGRALPQINALVRDIDGVMDAFAQERYYEDPQFHTSFISWVIPPEKSAHFQKTGDTSMQELLPEGVGFKALQAIHREASLDSSNPFLLNISKIVFKSGNKLFNIYLK